MEFTTCYCPHSQWLCRKFSFEPIWGMLTRGDSRGTARESNDGAMLQGGPFPPGDHSHGRALVCGVSLKLSACRRTPGGVMYLQPADICPTPETW